LSEKEKKWITVTRRECGGINTGTGERSKIRGKGDTFGKRVESEAVGRKEKGQKRRRMTSCLKDGEGIPFHKVFLLCTERCGEKKNELKGLADQFQEGKKASRAVQREGPGSNHKEDSDTPGLTEEARGELTKK